MAAAARLAVTRTSKPESVVPSTVSRKGCDVPSVRWAVDVVPPPLVVVLVWSTMLLLAAGVN